MCPPKNIELLNLLKNIFTIGLILVFIISTSGVTILKHTCSGSKKTTQQILPEITGNKDDCGGMSCNITQKNSSSLFKENICKTPCCKENTAFYKVAPVNDPPVKQLCIKIPVLDLLISLSQFHSLFPANYNILLFKQKHRIISHLAGRQLVVFLQQICIPTPSCFL